MSLARTLRRALAAVVLFAAVTSVAAASHAGAFAGGAVTVAASLPAPLGEIDSEWTGGGGDRAWTNAQNWDPEQVPDNDENNTFNVTLVGPPTLGDTITISSLSLGNGPQQPGSITGSGAMLTVEGLTSVSSARFTGSGTFLAQGGFDVFGPIFIGDDWQVSAGTIFMNTGAQWNLQGNAQVSTDVLEFLDDGDVSNFGGENYLLSVGIALRKSGGFGASDIAVPFRQEAGLIEASVGALRFQSRTELSGDVLASGGSELFFSGEMTGRATLVATNNAGMVIDGDMRELQLGGRANDTSKIFSAGSLIEDCLFEFEEGDTPFSLSSATMDGVTNRGFLVWNTGDVVGNGLTNERGGTLTVGSDGIGDPRILDSALRNNGDVAVQRLIRLGDKGKIEHFDGTWTFMSGSNPGVIADGNGMTTALFDHDAEIKVEMSTDLARARILCPIDSTGLFTVQRGELRLHSAVPDTQVLNGAGIVVKALPSSALFSIGENSTSRSSARDLSFQLTNATARWLAGIHKISGRFVASGAGQVVNAGATMTVDDNFTATLAFPPLALFVMDSVNARFEVNGTLTNERRVRWNRGSLFGTGEAVNAEDAEWDVFEEMKLTQTGTLRNEGALTLKSGRVTIDEGAQLINLADGKDGNSGLILLGDQDIEAGNGFGVVRNSGLLEKRIGEGLSQITVNYQSAAGTTRALAGTLRLFGNLIEIIGGGVEALEGSRILVDDDSYSSGVEYTFSDNGTVEYAAATGQATHEIDGTLSGTGQGQMRMAGGVMKPRDRTAVLAFSQPTPFHLAAGTLDGTEAGAITNNGELLQTGGTLAGTLANNGLYTLDGGTMAAFNLRNEDTANTMRGTVTGKLTNSEGATLNVIGEDFKCEFENAVIDNRGIVNMNTGTLYSGMLINRLDGTWDVEDGLFFSGSFRNDGILTIGGGIYACDDCEAVLENSASGQIIITGKDLVLFDLLGGRAVNAGRIRKISPQDASITRVRSSGAIESSNGRLTVSNLDAEDGAILRTNGAGAIRNLAANTTGRLRHELSDNTVIEHGNCIFDGVLESTGQGAVDFGVDGNRANSFEVAELHMARSAPATFQGVIKVLRDLENHGVIDLRGAEIQLGRVDSAGTVTNDDIITILDDTPTSLITLGLFTSEFINKRVLDQRDGAGVVVQGLTEVTNDDDWSLLGTGGITKSPNDFDPRFINNGKFIRAITQTEAVVNVPFDNRNIVDVSSGGLKIVDKVEQLAVGDDELAGGIWIVENATLLLSQGQTILENSARILLAGTAVFHNLPDCDTRETFFNENELVLTNGAALCFGGGMENNGRLSLDNSSITVMGEFENNDDLELTGNSSVDADVIDNDGSISGNAMIRGGRIVNRQMIMPGTSPGRLTLDGDLTNEPTSVVQIELAGYEPGTEYDQLIVTGDASLAGELQLVLLDEFVPLIGDTFQVLTAGSISGKFERVALVDFPPDLDADVSYDDTTVTVTIAEYRLPGDIDGDRDVDADDYALFAGCMAGPGVTQPPLQCEPADFEAADLSGDDDVDLADFSGLLEHFGR